MGDRKAAAECGLTILRAGGNEVSALDWRHGFFGKGNDWFFTNYGAETPPEKNWLVAFHGENRKAGLETYLTVPTMGRIAKDGTSVAFDVRKVGPQEDSAGKHQPGDRQAFAGNGVKIVQGKKQEIEPNPDDTSVELPGRAGRDAPVHDRQDEVRPGRAGRREVPRPGQRTRPLVQHPPRHAPRGRGLRRACGTGRSPTHPPSRRSTRA